MIELPPEPGPVQQALRERLEYADLFRPLRLAPGELAVEPLERGTWR